MNILNSELNENILIDLNSLALPTEGEQENQLPEGEEANVKSTNEPENVVEVADEISWDQIIQLAQDNTNDVYLMPDDNNHHDIFTLLNMEGKELPSDQTIIIEVINYNENISNAIETSSKMEKAIVKETKISQPIKINHEESLMKMLNSNPCFKQLKDNNIKLQTFLKEHAKIDLKIHNKKGDGPFECNLCERVFVHASGLNRHMEKHTSEYIPNSNIKYEPYQTIVKCSICGRLFANHHAALDHMKFDHQAEYREEIHYSELESFDDDIVIPDSTNTTDNYPEDLLIINELIGRELTKPRANDDRTVKMFDVVILNCVFQCEFCDYLFGDVAQLMNHQKSHDPLSGYECRSCDIYVDTLKGILLHWQIECIYQSDQYYGSIKLQRHYLCNICFETFKTIDLLYSHRYANSHLFPRICHATGKLKVICEICGSVHETAKSMIDHYNQKHVTVKKANKKISKPEPIVRSRQFLCDVCGKSYTQSSHLWQHLRFHRGVKPFACSVEGCTRKFTIRPDLNDHIRKCHTGERPYQCLVCGKRFLTGSVFYQHRLIHRGERRYGCEQCGKRFYRADALKNHIRIHTGEKPYPCEYCSKAFRQRGDKDKHIRARHYAFLNKNMVKPNAVKFPIPNHVQNKVVYVGDVAFPQSMFQPMIRDIDSIDLS